jgi:dTDP-4-amino-4,6-dideoxygalactose transaminase
MTTKTSMEIPFFRYPHVFTQHREELLNAVHDVLERGSFILQEDLAQFEQEVAEFVGSKHAIGVADGTESMILALLAAGIGQGDEVIFCSHTYIATADAIHFVGATPVPCDMGFDNLMDPDDVRTRITTNTKVIMPTQLNGRVCDMTRLQEIADEHGLLIIEDAAQALGAKFDGKCAGTFGYAGSISLYPAKVLGCFGDGGLLFTQDDETAKVLRQLRDHGRNEEGVVVRWGLNSRLDNLQAAVLRVKLRHFAKDIDRRREIATLYSNELGDLHELQLPPTPDSDQDHFDIYQNYEIQADSRNDLQSYLRARGIGTIVQWAGKAVHQFPELDLGSHSIPKVEAFVQRCLLLPMNTSLSNEEIEYTCEQTRSFYAGDR